MTVMEFTRLSNELNRMLANNSSWCFSESIEGFDMSSLCVTCFVSLLFPQEHENKDECRAIAIAPGCWCLCGSNRHVHHSPNRGSLSLQKRLLLSL
jgi:hypothetical protein